MHDPWSVYLADGNIYSLIFTRHFATCVHQVRPKANTLATPSRKMRLNHLVLATLTLLLASCEAFAGASYNKITTTAFAAERVRKLLSFGGAVLNQPKSTGLSFTKEVRGKKSTSGASVRSSILVGGTAPTSHNGNGGGTVTVTKYNNNGLLQRFKRWWSKLFSRESSSSNRRLRLAHSGRK